MSRTIDSYILEARAASLAGKDREALTAYGLAAALARQALDYDRLAYLLRHISELATVTGDINRGQAAGTEAIDLYQSQTSPLSLNLANALRVTALALEGLKDPIQARTLWIMAESLYRQFEIEPGVVECQHHILKIDAET